MKCWNVQEAGATETKGNGDKGWHSTEWKMMHMCVKRHEEEMSGRIRSCQKREREMLTYIKSVRIRKLEFVFEELQGFHCHSHVKSSECCHCERALESECNEG